jgi:hypothetical protein
VRALLSRDIFCEDGKIFYAGFRLSRHYSARRRDRAGAMMLGLRNVLAFLHSFNNSSRYRALTLPTRRLFPSSAPTLTDRAVVGSL